MDLRSVVLKTRHLRLVPIHPVYRQEIFEAFTKNVAHYTFPQPTGDIADTCKFISDARQRMAHGDELQFVVLKEESSFEFLGCAGLHHIHTRPEPGLWLKESIWGLGYGFEVVRNIKKWADEYISYEELGHEYLYYPVKKENIASRRIAEKLGGILEEEFVAQNARGEEYPMVAYRIYRGAL